MIKTDLITGFLGSGKTTFLKKYVKFLLSQNVKVGILENDYGAVNVDVMLLNELEKAGCLIESVAGACDRDCHQRRFKTKLIALAMSGCERVIIEPSGIFDTDEFFDSLREEPLDRWYETGSVIAVADGGLENDLSDFSEYMLSSQCANAGKIVISKTQLYSAEKVGNTVMHIRNSLNSIGTAVNDDDIVLKNWDEFTDEDMLGFMNCGYKKASFVKKYRETEGFSTLYFMNTGLSKSQAAHKAADLLKNPKFGNVFRVKGFLEENGCWYELNSAASGISLSKTGAGQDIIIVIGEHLEKEIIQDYLGGSTNA